MPRFVNNANERTVAKYHFSVSGDPSKAKIPNKVLPGEQNYEGPESGVTILTNGSESSDIFCSLGFFVVDDIEADRKRLASTLLNQLHLIFLLYRMYQDKKGADRKDRLQGKAGPLHTGMEQATSMKKDPEDFGLIPYILPEA